MAANFNQANQFAGLTTADGVQYIIIEDMAQALEIDATQGQGQIIVQGLPQEMLQPNSEIILEDGTRAIIQGTPQSLDQQVLIQDGQETIMQEIPQGMMEVGKGSAMQETAQIVFHDEQGNVLHTDNPIVVQHLAEQAAASSSNPRSLLRQRSPEKKTSLAVSTAGDLGTTVATNGHDVVSEMPAEILQGELTVVEQSDIPQTVVVSEAMTEVVSAAEVVTTTAASEVPMSPPIVSEAIVKASVSAAAITVPVVSEPAVSVAAPASEAEPQGKEAEVEADPKVATPESQVKPPTAPTVSKAEVAAVTAPTKTDALVTAAKAVVTTAPSQPPQVSVTKAPVVEKPAEEEPISMASTVITIKALQETEKVAVQAPSVLVPRETKAVTRRTAAARAKHEPIHTTVTADAHVDADASINEPEMEVHTTMSKPGVSTVVNPPGKSNTLMMLPGGKPIEITTGALQKKVPILPKTKPSPVTITAGPALQLQKPTPAVAASQHGTMVVKVVSSPKSPVTAAKPPVKIVTSPNMPKSPIIRHGAPQVKVMTSPIRPQIKVTSSPKPAIIRQTGSPKPAAVKVVSSPRPGFPQVITSKPGQVVVTPKPYQVVIGPTKVGSKSMSPTSKPGLKQVVVSPAAGSSIPSRVGSSGDTPMFKVPIPKILVQPADDDEPTTGKEPQQVPTSTSAEPEVELICMEAEDGYTMELDEKTGMPIKVKVPAPKPAEPERRRGRPRKSDHQPKPDTTGEVSESTATEDSESEAKPQRGRARKSTSDKEVEKKKTTDESEDSETEAKPQRGRARRSTSDKEEKKTTEPEAEAPKKRGRPRKSTTETKPEDSEKEDEPKKKKVPTATLR